MELRAGYKQTDIGIIPEDWEVIALGKVGNFSKGSGVRKDEALSGEIPCIRYGEIYTRHNNYIKQFYSFISKDIAETAKKLKKGDVLFAGSGETKEEIGKSVAFIDDFEAYAGGDIVILSPTNAEPLYLGYLLNAPFIQKQKASRGQGDAVVHISATQLGNVSIPLPPTKSEQTSIAAAISNTDDLMNSLEKLITKKRNIKQGAMQKLLEPKKGWEEKKLGEVGKCHRGVSYNPDMDLHSHDKENTVRLLRSNNIQNGNLDFEGLQFVDSERVKPNQILQETDIVICMANGSKQLVGKSAIFNADKSYKYTFGAFMGCFRTDSNLASSAYVALNFQSFKYRNYIDVLLSGSSINNLNPSNIESISIPFPSIEEQNEIANIITDMDKEILTLESKFEKYTKVKLGMMQNLLTGKIRLV